MNPVNQAQMKEFAEAYDLTKKTESDQFELYTVYSIVSGGSGENVDPFDIHLSGTEFGLDGVAIIVQGNLVTDADEAATAVNETKNPQIDFYFFQSKTSMVKYLSSLMALRLSFLINWAERVIN